ncbi:MAG: arylsulfatase [Balneolales bacterium]
MSAFSGLPRTRPVSGWSLDMKNIQYVPLARLMTLASAMLLLGCSMEQQDPVSGPKPNIIYIIADDLGYGDLGSYGQAAIQTPNLDRMAEEGMRFTRHYSGSTVCAPSRSVLMTGLHSGHTQIRDNREFMPIGQYPLQYGTVTLGRLLGEAGYATGAYGKWGLGYPGSSGQPSLQGFDEFFGLLGQRRSHFYYPEFLFHDVKGEELKRVQLEGNVVDDTARESFQHPGSGPALVKRHYSPDVIHDRALQFIEEHSREPFFLFYPTQIPHASLSVPGETLALYLDENGESIFTEDPRPAGHYAEQAMARAAYAAMVTHLDKQVGEIFNKLEEQGIAGNTLVIFTSDNGSHSEGGYHYSMHHSNGSLRGGKRDLYEGGIRVPAIAWWPGKIKAGTTNDHLSGFQDMLPTFSELAGIRPPPGLDGISMVPALLGTGAQKKHDHLYWEFHAQGGKQAVREDKWKAVRLDVRSREEAPVELYNLEEDEAEQHNIAGRHPERTARMRRIMDRAHVHSETFPLFEH